MRPLTIAEAKVMRELEAGTMTREELARFFNVPVAKIESMEAAAKAKREDG